MDPREFFRSHTGLRRHERDEVDHTIPLRGLNDSDRLSLWFVRGLLEFNPPIETEDDLKKLLDNSNFMTLGANAMRFFEAFYYDSSAKPEFERLMKNIGVRVIRTPE